jgi:hypothetical protein
MCKNIGFGGGGGTFQLCGVWEKDLFQPTLFVQGGTSPFLHLKMEIAGVFF